VLCHLYIGLLSSLLPGALLCQPPRVTISEIEASLRGGSSAARLNNVIAETCVVGTKLSEPDERRLRDAGATSALIIIVKAQLCGVPADSAKPSVPANRTVSSAPPRARHASIEDFEFVRVLAGKFQMGSKRGFKDEQPPHKVTITRPFLLQRTEVTQAQWRSVMRGTELENPSFHANCDDCPVEQVSWEDVQQFIARLNANEPNKRFRLPTEAEWEYAARAQSGDDFIPSATAVQAIAWVAANSMDSTHEVAAKPSSTWGLYDMRGNVWEWVQDAYGEYSGDDAIDPRGPKDRLPRVVRGGSFTSDWAFTTFAVRSPNGARSRNRSYGFRLARDIP
jgi:formylglycine-generating enzyme required for sulfatase activity